MPSDVSAHMLPSVVIKRVCGLFLLIVALNLIRIPPSLMQEPRVLSKIISDDINISNIRKSHDAGRDRYPKKYVIQ